MLVIPVSNKNCSCATVSVIAINAASCSGDDQVPVNELGSVQGLPSSLSQWKVTLFQCPAPNILSFSAVVLNLWFILTSVEDAFATALNAKLPIVVAFGTLIFVKGE